MRAAQAIRTSVLSASIAAVIAGINPSAGSAGAPTAFSLQTPSFEIHAPSAEGVPALAQEIDAAALRFRAFFGADPPPIGVFVFGSPEERRSCNDATLRREGIRWVPWVLRPAGRTDGVVPASQRLSAHPWMTRSLAHEVGHAFLSAHVDSRLGRVAKLESGDECKGHGSHDDLIPDWFEEAVAALCEPADRRAALLSAARRHLDGRTPLHILLTMNRPEGEAGDPTLAESKRLFYTQSHAVAAYIVEKAGAASIGAIADALAKGRASTQAIRDLTSLPADIAALESAWVAWMEMEVGRPDERAGAPSTLPAPSSAPSPCDEGFRARDGG